MTNRPWKGTCTCLLWLLAFALHMLLALTCSRRRLILTVQNILTLDVYYRTQEYILDGKIFWARGVGPSLGRALKIYSQWDHLLYTTCILNGRIGSFGSYNFDPLKLYFYIVKLGLIGVNIVFHILFKKKNTDCGYSLEPPYGGGSNEYPQSMFWAEIWKISEFFIWKKNSLSDCKIFNIFE